MDLTAKIVNLRTCPTVWANLSFEVGGIVEQSNVVLGQPIEAPTAPLDPAAPIVSFDFASFYATLGVGTESQLIVPNKVTLARRTTGGNQGGGIQQNPFVQPNPAALYNSGDIQSQVATSTLFALRAEPIKAALDKACAVRANVYYAQFANQTAIIAKMRQNNAATTTNLTNLQGLATSQFTSLNAQYNASGTWSPTTINGRLGVVQSTTSNLVSGTLPSQQQTQTVSTDPQGATTTEKSGPVSVDTGPFGNLLTTPNALLTDDNASLAVQVMSYTDYGYRIPSIECNAQNQRAQISLRNEQFSQFMAGQVLSTGVLETVFANQLTSIDMDVKRLQVAYLNTILMSPITGTVTGVYKNVGDRVLPGETVIRVENSNQLYLVGVIICRGMISLNSTVTLTTNLYSSPPPVASITGTVVAARGHQSGDDRWEVVILYDNSGTNGAAILPINYNFDFDDTINVTISQ
jgi:hypothetical protein